MEKSDWLSYRNSQGEGESEETEILRNDAFLVALYVKSSMQAHCAQTGDGKYR